MEEEKKDIQIIDNNFYLSDEKFQNYWFWHGLWKSKSGFAKNSLLLKNEKRQKNYLTGQIIKHYFKNFFLFPIWLLSLLVPSYLKGKNNLWTNLKTILVNKEFKPLRIALLSQFIFVIVLGLLGYTVFKNSQTTKATDYSWVQSDWSGGADTNSTSDHANNSTNWTNYYSASSTLEVSSIIALALQTIPAVETSDNDFNSGVSVTTTIASGSVGLSQVQVVSSTVFSTSGMVEWVVPDGNDSITVDVNGSQGSANMSYYSDQGGKGGRVQATYPVSAGETIYIYVGERVAMYTFGVSAFNGGGAGGSNGGAGGGASDIRIGGTALTDRVIVGAGGGGGSYDQGVAGYGGYPDGMTGNCIVGQSGGGTQSSGGAGGVGINGGPAAGSGSLGQGGYGGSRGGGGGGGYYGGGGCNYGGGAGGSSYADPNATNVTYTSNYRSGSGLVSISYYAPAAIATYYSSGIFTSDVIALELNLGFTTLDYSTTLNGQTITLDIRAGDSATVDGTWTDWVTSVASGGDISSLGTHRYVQYRANLSTNDTSVTPTLDDVTINYTNYPTSGTLVSTAFDSGEANIILNNLSWTETLETDTDVQLQLRTSPDGTTWTDWMGPDGSTSTYFTDNTGGEIMPESISDATNDRWIQYQVILTSTGSATPSISSITLAMNPPAPPGAPVIGDFTDVTTSTITLNWGTVTDTVYYIVSSTVPDFTSVTTTEITYTFDSGLEPNTRYYYEVVARDQYDQDSATSTQRSKYTNPNIPLAVSATANGQTSANLTWSANSNPTDTVYQIYDNNSVLRGSTTSTSYTVTGLTSGTSYTFTVRAIYNSDNVTYEESVASSSITTAVPAKAVSLVLTPTSAPTSFIFSGSTETHTAEVSAITQVGDVYKASLTLHSNEVSTGPLGSGESVNVDLSGNGSNDTTVTMNSVTANNASFTLSAIPQGSSGMYTNPPTIKELTIKDQEISSTTTEKLKAVVINNGAKTTNKTKVTLNFNIQNANQMAISNDPEFEGISYQSYQDKITNWKLTEGNGTKIVYVRFRSKEGGTITYSGTIILTAQITDDPNAINLEELEPEIVCDLKKEQPYKTSNSSAVYYLTKQCTKRAFPNPQIYFSYFMSWNQVKVIIKEELNKIKDDSNYLMILNPIIDLKENTLIKTIDNPKVYVIQNDERHWIKTEETFNNLNYHWNEVVTVGDDVLGKYLEGDDIE